MATNEPVPSKSDPVPSPEAAESSSSKSSIAFSSDSSHSRPQIYRKYSRSKSLSHMVVDDYTAGEIRRINERLLRYVSRELKYCSFILESFSEQILTCNLRHWEASPELRSLHWLCWLWWISSASVPCRSWPRFSRRKRLKRASRRPCRESFSVSML